MNRYYVNTVLAAALFYIGLPTTAWPQTTTLDLLLLQAQGARGLALGESFVAVADGANSLYWNPAGLVSADKGLQGSFSHRPGIFLDTMKFEHGTLAYQVSNRLAIGAYGSYMSLGRLDFTDVQVFSYSINAAVAYRLAQEFAVGLTLKRVSQSLGMTAHALAVDFGLLYHINNVFNGKSWQGRLSLGGSLSNLGQEAEFTEIQNIPLPRILRLGLAYDLTLLHTDAKTGWRTFTMLLVFEYQNLLNNKREGNIWE